MWDQRAVMGRTEAVKHAWMAAEFSAKDCRSGDVLTIPTSHSGLPAAMARNKTGLQADRHPRMVHALRAVRPVSRVEGPSGAGGLVAMGSGGAIGGAGGSLVLTTSQGPPPMQRFWLCVPGS